MSISQHRILMGPQATPEGRRIVTLINGTRLVGDMRTSDRGGWTVTTDDGTEHHVPAHQLLGLATPDQAPT